MTSSEQSKQFNYSFIDNLGTIISSNIFTKKPNTRRFNRIIKFRHTNIISIPNIIHIGKV